MGYPKIESRVTAPGGGWAISVDDGGGAVTATIPAGTYYLSSAGSGARSLLAELEYQLENTAGIGGAWTVSLDSAGKVTIAYGGGTFTLVWTSTVFRDVLGFDVDLTPTAASFTGAEQAEPIWQPSAGFLDSYTPISVAAASIAPTGHATRVEYAQRENLELIWQQVPGRWVKAKHETVANESWETFWRNYAAAGAPLRVYADRDVASYTTYVLTDNQLLAAPINRGWDSAVALFDVTMHLEEQP